MAEANFIANTKARNADLFAAEFIRIKPEALEQLLRVAYRAGGEDVREGLRATMKPGEDLFSQMFRR